MGPIAIALALSAIDYNPRAYMALPGTAGKPARRYAEYPNRRHHAADAYSTATPPVDGNGNAVNVGDMVRLAGTPHVVTVTEIGHHLTGTAGNYDMAYRTDTGYRGTAVTGNVVAYGRPETEPCQRGTIGCAVDHADRNTPCEPW